MQEIAVDGVIRRGELVSRDVMEGRHHPGLRAEQLLDFLGRGALGRGREESSPAEGQGHHGADDDLAPARVLEIAERGREAAGGEGEHDDLRARRRVAVRRPAQLDLGLRSQRLGLRARPVGVARADDDLVARLCPAEGEPRTFLAGAAEYADEHREGS